MLSKGYVATKEDLNNCSAKQLAVTRASGMLGRHRTANVSGYLPWFTIRPGLKNPLEFYCVTHHNDWYVIALSDDTQTRYYRMHNGKRDSIIVDSPSHSFEAAWENMFKGLLADERLRSVSLYNHMAEIFLAHFKAEAEPKTFAVEGTWDNIDFIASVEWSPSLPHKLQVSSTLDSATHRTVPFTFHPIEAAHRAAFKA